MYRLLWVEWPFYHYRVIKWANFNMASLSGHKEAEERAGW